MLDQRRRGLLPNQRFGPGNAGQPSFQDFVDAGTEQTQANRQRISNPALQALSGVSAYNSNQLYAGRGFMTTGGSLNSAIAAQTGVPGNLLDQAGRAFAGDFDALTQAEDERFSRASDALAATGQYLDRLPEDAAGIVNDAIGSAMSGPNARFNEFADTSLAYNRDAISSASSAVDTIAGTISSYEDHSAALTAATINGDMAGMEMELRRVESGVNPDGSLMTPQQREASRRGLQDDFRRRAATTQITIAEQSQNALNTLRLNMSGAQMQRANVENAAAANATNLASIQSSLQQFNASLGVNARLSALQARASGNMQLAQLYMQHTYSPVSMLSGILALGQAQQSGLGNAAAVSF